MMDSTNATDVSGGGGSTTTSSATVVNVSGEVTIFDGGRIRTSAVVSNQDDYFELRIPENIVELQQEQTLSVQLMDEFEKCQDGIDNFKLEILRCKACKYRCIFREEILQHMKNVHYPNGHEIGLSSIATVIDVLMEGLSSEVLKSQNYPNNTATRVNNTEQVSEIATVGSEVDKIGIPVVGANTQDGGEQDYDQSTNEVDENHPKKVGKKTSSLLPASRMSAESQTKSDSAVTREKMNAVLHSRVDLSAIAKSAAECNPKATKITVFQHLNDSDAPAAIHFRRSRKSDAIIPTRDSLGITSPFLNNEYRGAKHFACTQCHSRYKTERELTNHITKKHQRSRSFLCEICGMELATQVSAKYHAVRMHMNKNELYQCDKCEYVTRFERRIVIHRAKHQSQFYCEVCKKMYVSKLKLEKHYQSPKHKNVVNPLICEHCGYSSNKKDNFLVHMRKHTGEKPYKCNHCSYASADGSTLKKHVMARHSNIRPFKCEFCSFSCVDKKGLTIHLRKHTGERPFRCDHCSYAAKRRSALKVHLQTHSHGSNRKLAQIQSIPIKKKQQTEPSQYPRISNIDTTLEIVQQQSGTILPQSQASILQTQSSQPAIIHSQPSQTNVMQMPTEEGSMLTTQTGVMQNQPNPVAIMHAQSGQMAMVQNHNSQTGIIQSQSNVVQPTILQHHQEQQALLQPSHQQAVSGQIYAQHVPNTVQMMTTTQQETEQSVTAMWQNM